MLKGETRWQCIRQSWQRRGPKTGHGAQARKPCRLQEGANA
jgi:hypothetical protein